MFLRRREAALRKGVWVIHAASVVHRGVVWSLNAPARHGDVMRLPGWLFPFDELIGDGGPDAQGFVAMLCGTDGPGGRRVIENLWIADRKMAAEIALEAGQVEALRWGPELFTEDLW